jgi:hypothetical protein
MATHHHDQQDGITPVSTREYAKNLFTTWSDEDFCSQPIFDKLLYQVLAGQRAVNAAGIQPINFTRWRKAMRDGDTLPTEEQLRDALTRMERRRYIYLDEDTGEVLIRSRMRRDELDKQPTAFLAALRLLAVLDSPKFASVMITELDRMDIPVVKSDKAYAKVLQDNLAQAYPDARNHLKQIAEQYVPTPTTPPQGPTTGVTPGPTSGDTSGPTSGDTSGPTSRPGKTGPTTGPTPGDTTGPSGSGSVSGSLTYVDGDLRDSRARTRDAEPTDDPEPPRRCKAHTGLPADAEIPNCGPCANFTAAHARWQIRDRRRRAQATSHAAQARATVKADAIANCTLCGPDGYVDGATTPCTHDPAQAATNAKGSAAVRAALAQAQAAKRQTEPDTDTADEQPQPEQATTDA